MQKFKIVTVFTTIILASVITVSAQQQQINSAPFYLVVPCGIYAEEQIGGSLFINEENQLVIKMDDPSWIVAEMNKADLIDAIASSGGLTKAKDTKANKRAGQELKKEIMTLYKTTLAQKDEPLFNLDEVLTSAKIFNEDGTVFKVLVRVSFEPGEGCYIPVINGVLVDCW